MFGRLEPHGDDVSEIMFGRLHSNVEIETLLRRMLESLEWFIRTNECFFNSANGFLATIRRNLPPVFCCKLWSNATNSIGWQASPHLPRGNKKSRGSWRSWVAAFTPRRRLLKELQSYEHILISVFSLVLMSKFA